MFPLSFILTSTAVVKKCALLYFMFPIITRLGTLMGNESDWHIKLVYDLAYQNYLFDDLTVKLQ